MNKKPVITGKYIDAKKWKLIVVTVNDSTIKEKDLVYAMTQIFGAYLIKWKQTRGPLFLMTAVVSGVTLYMSANEEPKIIGPK